MSRWLKPTNVALKITQKTLFTLYGQAVEVCATAWNAKVTERTFSIKCAREVKINLITLKTVMMLVAVHLS